VELRTFNILRLKRKLSGPLITYVKSDFDETALTQLVQNPSWLSESGEYSVFSCFYEDKEINFMGTGSGPASLLTGLFEVLSSNLSTIVRIGACGGLNETKLGEIIISDKSTCMDKVSLMLAKDAEVLADPKLTHQISNGFRNDGILARIGHVASVDAMYMFEAEIDSAAKNGARCWDLETSTLLAFGKRFGIKAVSILEVVSDKNGAVSETYPPIQHLGFVRSTIASLSNSQLLAK
jgi:uridine phosphorylase